MSGLGRQQQSREVKARVCTGAPGQRRPVARSARRRLSDAGAVTAPRGHRGALGGFPAGGGV